CRSTRASPDRVTGATSGVGSGSPRSSDSLTIRPQTRSNGTCPASSSTSTPRYRSAEPSLSGSAISVSKATTPSSPRLAVELTRPLLRKALGPRRRDKVSAMTDVLIYGDTVRHPELRHEVPLALGDPFLYLEKDGRSHI